MKTLRVNPPIPNSTALGWIQLLLQRRESKLFEFSVSLFCFPGVDFDEEMGSEEESGKDWSELEEEAARGEPYIYIF